MVAIIILAAGSSSRMRGGDKLLEEVDGRPCLTTLIHRAQATGMESYVVLPSIDHPRADAARGARLVASPDWDRGMGHSIAAGIAALDPHTDAAILLPGDMPDITTEDLQIVAQGFRHTGTGIIQATTQSGAPGHPTLFAKTYFPALKQLTGDQGARSIIAAHPDDLLRLPLSDGRARLDLDTPEDWAAWRSARPLDR